MHEARAVITKSVFSFSLTILKESGYYNDYVESAESSERYLSLFSLVINILFLHGSICSSSFFSPAFLSCCPFFFNGPVIVCTEVLGIILTR